MSFGIITSIISCWWTIKQFEFDLVTRESVEQMYRRANQKLALTLTTLLNAGEIRPSPQEVFSSSEIKATLGMIGDVSTIGYCTEAIRLKSRFWRRGIDPGTHELESIIERSVAEDSLTFPCDVSGARTAALVVHGRPDHLFTQAISKGRSRLEKLTTVSKIRYGDYPDRNSKYLSAITPRLRDQRFLQIGSDEETGRGAGLGPCQRSTAIDRRRPRNLRCVILTNRHA